MKGGRRNTENLKIFKNLIRNGHREATAFIPGAAVVALFFVPQ